MILLEQVGFTYADGAVGLQDVSFAVPAGELVVVAGANGSGKTTLLKHLNGLLLPQRGRVAVDNVCTRDDPHGVRRRVGMVFQHADAQIVGETVADDVAFGPENLVLTADEIAGRVSEALTAVGLEDLSEARPHVLSGGEKRRLAVAGALAMHPRVVLFDEPFSNLDYPGVRQVLTLMVDLHRGGQTVIVATHELEKVLAHADRLVVLDGGRIVRDGRPQQLAAEVEHFGLRPPPRGERWSWLN